MSKVINYKTPVTQHETIIDVEEERRSSGRAFFMRDISGYITEDNKASYKGKTVYELYSIFIYIGKSNLLLFSADGKQRAKYEYSEYFETWTSHDIISQCTKYSSLFCDYEI